MSTNETIVEGTIQPDGTLVLDEKPKLAPGPVTVVLRREAEITLPRDDPFWQRMEAMWAIPTVSDTGDGGERSSAEIRQMRDEWDKHQQAIEQLQDECRAARNSPEGPRS